MAKATYDVVEVNTQTGEVTTRNFTPEEIANQELIASQIAEEQAAQTAARQAILDRLGITAQEAAILLG